MVELSTTRLAELVARRRRCLEQLLAIGLRQADLIAVGNMADLMRLLAAKQQLIAALQTMEKELAPYQDQEPESRRWSSPEERARCAADADHCRRLIAEVMALEQAGERQMTVRRDEAAVQLHAVSSAGRIRQAYQNQM
ncbi:MAG TPA: flagellar export chaperone FlgN [Lacipirellulaceae bacterium]|nr:flagellar export chaperone FlgN [Lacipirellulaceae bacterium]